MIKANELRVNNLVNWGRQLSQIKGIHTQTFGQDDGYHFYINVFSNSNLNYYSVNPDDIEPIPLTEEWLLKFGFNVREASTSKYFYIGVNEVTKDWLFDLVWLDKPELIGAPNAPFYRNGRHTIYFVHQLQNLYFALTGEELTFNQ